MKKRISSKNLLSMESSAEKKFEEEIPLKEVDLVEDINKSEPLQLLLKKEEIKLDSGTIHTYALLNFDELPGWLKDNQFIRKGYRVNFSAWLCCTSCFKHHNETLSIWTHGLGFLMFFLFMLLTPSVFLESPKAMDVFVFMVFLVCAQCQMLFSTVFHLFHCVSPKYYHWLVKLDYTGICLMIVGSYYPPLYYGFCDQGWRIAHLSLISLIGVVSVIITCMPIFSTPRYRVIRTVFFIVFGGYAVIPLPHMIYLSGFTAVWPVIWRESLMGALYITGAVIYGSRIPERYYPGAFDYSLGSHTIWHLFTIAAACLQLYTCIFVFQSRNQTPC